MPRTMQSCRWTREKAFDRIEWRYLFDGYNKWIKLLDNDPQAEIITNNQISKLFNLSRGTRQEFPLSPLLFLFTVEPLAMAIWSSPEIKGIIIGEREQFFSVFRRHSPFS